MKFTTVSLMALITASSLMHASVHAEIFRWTDENGDVHFTDNPPPNKGKKVEVDIAQPSKAPDVGEQRRLNLLELARRRDAHKAATETAEARESAVAVTTDDASACFLARNKWYSITQDMPVYWAEDGTIRGQWVSDIYTGERDYIADADRPELMDRIVQQIRKVCPNGATDESDGSGYAAWLRADDCQVDQSKLAQARAPRSRATKQTLRDLEASVASNCD